MSTLALDGAAPVRTLPLAPWPVFAPDEVQAVVDVLQSGRVNYWTGQVGRSFERAYAAYVGSPYAIAVANGTVSIEAILHAMDIGPGDEVITTPRTFVGTATAIVARGAIPVFADVDPDSQNITASTIAPHITARTCAILPVHLAGWPCELGEMMDLASAHNLKVIEDCAQSHGATWRGQQTGSVGHAASFSFCQDKILTTGGEGGLITTADETVWRRAWEYKDHGKSYDAVYHREHPPGFRWVVESFGTNWRMTEMQAAIGNQILPKLDGWVSQRRSNAHRIIDGISDIEALRVPIPAAHLHHSYYKLYAFVRPEALRDGWDRDRVLAAIGAEGIPCFSGSCSEIYLERAFPHWMRPPERLPVAKVLGETALMWLVHPTMTEQDVADTITAIRRVFSVASRAPVAQ